MECPSCGAKMQYHDLSQTYGCPECGHQVLAEPEQVEAEQALSLCVTALRFYADSGNYEGALPILADKGSLARETLQQVV